MNHEGERTMKTIWRTSGLLLALLLATPALATYFSVTILSAATATGAGSTYTDFGVVPRTYQCVVSGTGAVSATVYIEVSNNGTNWASADPAVAGPNQALIKLSPSGTTTASDVAAVPAAKWPFTRAEVIAISGTGAAVTCTVGG